MATQNISRKWSPFKAELTAKVFEAIDPSLGVEFLKAHPVTQFPEYWKPKREKFFFGLFSRPVRRKSTRVVTTAFATFLAAQLITDSTTIGDFKYHDSGIGVGDENIADVGLGIPWGGARDVGTQVQGASAVAYKSVATTTYNATKAITEHGLFSASTGVTLMDRSKFAAINVVDTNQIEWTYELTIAAGG
jgi:hypothetical protein